MSIPVSGSTNRLADLPVYHSANEANAANTTKAGATKDSGEATGNARTQAAAQLNSSILQSSINVNAGKFALQCRHFGGKVCNALRRPVGQIAVVRMVTDEGGVNRAIRVIGFEEMVQPALEVRIAHKQVSLLLTRSCTS